MNHHPSTEKPKASTVTTIRPYRPEYRSAILELSLRAWRPVFPLMRRDVPPFVYDSFYPDGWEKRQKADLAAVLDGEPANVDVAVDNDQPIGWVCTRIHPDDDMGEIHVLAVDPDHQRRGVGSALMEHAYRRITDAGMRMVMVETGDDSGHTSARHAYEADGFRRWPVARYFKDLGD